MEMAEIAASIAKHIRENPRHWYATDGRRLRAICIQKFGIYKSTLNRKMEFDQFFSEIKLLLKSEPAPAPDKQSSRSIKAKVEHLLAKGERYSFLIH